MENKLKSFRYALIGLTLMLFGYLATELVNLYKIYSITLWINWAVYIPGMALVVLGTIKLRSIRKELNYSFILSVAGLIFSILALAIVLKNYGAFGIVAFIDIKAMFLRYLADLSMIGIYFMSIKGFFQIMARSNVRRDFNGDLKKIKILIIVLIITMILVPFANAWVGVFKIVIGVIAIGANTFCKFSLLKMLEEVHSKMYVVKTKE